MSCGCEGKEPPKVKPPSSTSCGCAGARPNARRAETARMPVAVDWPEDFGEGKPKLDELASLLRHREIYWPPREILGRFDPGSRLGSAGPCETLPKDALAPRTILVPEDAGIRRIIEPKVRQAPKSEPNLLLQVPASLWVLRTIPGVVSPEQGNVECGDACASPARPPRSVADCALQVPPPETQFPFVQEPPQSEQLDESGLGDDCPSCGISSLGKNALLTKLGTPQVPYPMCHDPGYRFEDAYTPFVDPRPPEARGKGSGKLPCPCDCRCVVRLPFIDWGMGGPSLGPAGAALRLIRSHFPTDSVFPIETWPQPPPRRPDARVYAPPHTITPPRRDEVRIPATASGYAAGWAAMEQGQWIGAGENSGWELEVGDYRPPGTFDTASVLGQTAAVALSAPDHPASKGSMTFGLAFGMRTSDLRERGLLAEGEVRP